MGLDISRAVNPSFFTRVDESTTQKILINRLNLHLQNLTPQNVVIQVILDKFGSENKYEPQLIGPLRDIKLTPGQSIVVPAFIEWHEAGFSEQLSELHFSLLLKQEGAIEKRLDLIRKIKFIRVDQ